MKNFFTLIIALVIVQGAFAQKFTEQWRFGQYVGLSFNNDTVIAVTTSSLSTSEGCSSMADGDGKILFYTDGQFVYNKQDSLMPNGEDLLGDFSSTQAALIVPHPGNANQYYIFTTDDIGAANGFRYSVVDMTLDNGLGDITTKNTPLLSKVDEKLSGVSSSDGGYWIMVHEWPGDGFYAYKVTATGINTTPVVSHVGTVHSGNTIENTYGQMKFSPDGRKLALGIGYQDTYEIFDFNDSSGVVSNPISIPGSPRCYGLEFSPTGRRLYTTHNTVDAGTFALDQYDLISGVPATIINSRTEIITSDVVQFRQLQVAPNGKIYMATAYTPYVSVINNPDSLGAKCDFQSNVINLDPLDGGLLQCVIGLPNFVQSFFRGTPGAEFLGIDTFICPGSCVNFTDISRNNPNSWEWRFPSSNTPVSFERNPQNICYANPGDYTVTLIVGTGGSFDTAVIEQAVKVYNLPSISINRLDDTLKVFSGVSRQWNRNGEPIPGATDPIYIVTEPGDYTVTIMDEHGCVATSTSIIVTGIQELVNAGISVYPNPSPGGNWQLIADKAYTGSNVEVYDDNGRLVWRSEIRSQKSEIPATGLASGIYLLRISSGEITITRKLIRL